MLCDKKVFSIFELTKEMGSKKKASSKKKPRNVSQNRYTSISGLRAKHQQELQNLTLTTQPYRTVKLFSFGLTQYIRQSVAYLVAHRGFMLLSVLVGAAGILLVTTDGPHEKHMNEVFKYVEFGLWWMALGVASSIGLGSGLHTFVLYLGPHIALFTIRAMQCGRVDIKSAPYDTIQFNRGPSWLGKDCSEFGPPLFSSPDGIQVPLNSILPQVQLEAILWGIGTALGELPPYFISRAASLSGSPVDAMGELDSSGEKESGVIASHLNDIKLWFLSHSQYLNFLTILILASVPNPLFDLAGIMCGQFGIPFWEFFLATMLGKAIVKTHIQTVFIISVCNNQLLDWMENELIWVLGFVPGVDSILPNLVRKLHSVRNKYLATKPAAPANFKVKRWDFSLATIWNGVVWLMLLNFFVQIVNATAQRYLKKQLEKELAAIKTKSRPVDD